MRITHTEFCGALNHNTCTPMHNDVISGENVPAKPLILPINPGDGSTFPWLSGISTRFEKYKFTRIRVMYKPTCSTLENGGMAICPILDPNDPVPDDRHTLMNAQNSVVVPVHRAVSCGFPAAAMRPTDTMYIRDKHIELLDPAERRTTDLGYYAVMLTDTNPYADEQVPRNYGDVFIQYTVELSAPRAKGSTGKGAYIGDPDQVSNNIQTGEHGSFWHYNIHRKNGARGLVNDNSTLHVELEHNRDSYRHITTDKDINYSAIVFKEPFEGIAEITNVNNTEVGDDETANIMANGRSLQDHESSTMHWQLQTGGKHAHRLCRVKPLRTIKDGLFKVKHTVKVVAQAGETLAVALEHHGVNMAHWGEVLLSEVPEALLDTLPLLLAL
jgi:predicted nuclease of predicted toxin-antitoxin system